MKKKDILIGIFSIVLISVNGYSIKFRWAVEKGVTYKIVSYVYEEVFRNSVHQKTVDIRHKGLLKTIKTKTNAAFLKGDFYYYERRIDRKKEPFALKNIYPSRFWRDSLGRFTIDKKYYMPVVRNVPTFPEKDIKPGAMWRAKGYEVHDLKHYGITTGYRIPINARYIYVGNEIINGRKIAKFSITYVFTDSNRFNLKNYINKANRHLYSYRNNRYLYNRYRMLLQKKINLMKLAPKRISASVLLLYYWDIEKKLPYKVDEDFHFVFHLYNNEVHEYKGFGKSTFKKVVPINKQKSDMMVNKLKNKKLKGVTIKKDKRGIVLQFSHILFDFRKHHLKSKAKQQIRKISDVLKKYKKYDIRIEGHTDNIGDDNYNIRLSRKRAQKVALYLSELMKKDPRKVSWIGYGKRRPIANNNTEKGRAKNRRVEIIILTNE